MVWKVAAYRRDSRRRRRGTTQLRPRPLPGSKVWFSPGSTLGQPFQPWSNPGSTGPPQTQPIAIMTLASSPRRAAPRRARRCGALTGTERTRSGHSQRGPARPRRFSGAQWQLFDTQWKRFCGKQGVRIARCSEVRRGALHKCVHGSACDGGVDGADGPHTHGAVFVSRAPRAAVKGIRNKPCNLRCNLRPAARRRVPQTS